ncbi:MAG: outer membrane lipoprotein carrier protein LolA [Lentisphaeria bacterium]|nr:outer membrane lipoprotein carrier protein LolA [Lentisphaeria bacterium]
MPASLTSLLVLLTLSFGVCAQNIDSLSTRFRKIADYRTIRADFIQTRTLAELEMKIEIQGEMISEKNGRLRWLVRSPVKSITIIGQNELKHWDGETGKLSVIQQSRFPWLAVLRDCMNDWLSGDPDRLKKRFELTVKDGRILRLAPKEDGLKALFKAVEIRADASCDVIEAITIEETSGDRLEIRFVSVRKDPVLAESIWRLPPE